MSSLSSIFDAYNIRARLLPAGAVFFPIWLTVAAMFPAEVAAVSWLGAGVAWFIVAGALSQLVRERGRKREQCLFKEWDGKPSVRYFRHRDGSLTPLLKQRYHNILAKHLEAASAPSVDDERNDPSKADAIYESYSEYLVSISSNGNEYPLLKEENINYGYRRNVWGSRSIAIALSLLGLILCTWQGYNSLPGNISASLWTGFLLNALHALFFAVVVTKNWVKGAAEAYAKQLLRVTEKISSENAVKVGNA